MAEWLFGCQILFGASCFFAGLYLLLHTFEHSIRFKPSAGASRVGLGILGMTVGALIAAFAFYPL